MSTRDWSRAELSCADLAKRIEDTPAAQRQGSAVLRLNSNKLEAVPDSLAASFSNLTWWVASRCVALRLTPLSVAST